MILDKEFYNRDARVVAKDLLGKILVREVNGVKIRGKIVETEAYIGKIDKACHAYNGKRTARTETLYEECGVSYVYFIYGLYHCFNVITNKKDIAEGVLIRAIEPIDNLKYIAKMRLNKEYGELSNTQKKNLTNGPSKLCMALNITKEDNCKKLYLHNHLYIEENYCEKFQIVEAKRIGIDYAEEAKDFLWRYYIKNNKFVSAK